jgi:hypothetical protein
MKPQLKEPMQYVDQGSGYNNTPTIRKSLTVTTLSRQFKSGDRTASGSPEKEKREKETVCENRQNAAVENG